MGWAGDASEIQMTRWCADGAPEPRGQQLHTRFPWRVVLRGEQPVLSHLHGVPAATAVGTSSPLRCTRHLVSEEKHRDQLGPAMGGPTGTRGLFQTGTAGVAAARRSLCCSALGTECDATECEAPGGLLLPPDAPDRAPRGHFQLSLSISSDGTLLMCVISSRLFSK